MIGHVSIARHALVGMAIGGTTLLAAAGVIGGGNHPERFDAKTVVIEPDGDGIRVTEYVDIDFGDDRRRGYERRIPDDFGTPIAVEASSPDAADDLGVSSLLDGYTVIRIGNPDRTFTGQHRYRLAYTLPDAQYETLGLDVDIVFPPGGVFPGDPETVRFDVVITGFELVGIRCDVGRYAGATGGCVFRRVADDPPVYRATIEPLARNVGLSIGGVIMKFTEPVEVPAPDLPERRRGSDRAPRALGTAALGAAGAVPVYRWARRRGRNEVFSPNRALLALNAAALGAAGAVQDRAWENRRGRNEVFAGGAADAAYGSLPPPRTDGSVSPPPSVALVPDDEMADLATTEFVPPQGVAPWEASVLLTERLGNDAVEAWISSLVAADAIDIHEHDDHLVIGSGTRRGDLTEPDAQLLDAILTIDDPYTTGSYDPKFAEAWGAIARMQRARIAESGWWKHLPPGSGFRPKVSGSPFGLKVLAVFVLVWSGSALSALLGAFRSPAPALAIAIGFPALVAFFVYRMMLPARTAAGSALALRAESFRRFLHASEGRHVEWAWSHGLLRDYSAWAVALGEADAWSEALDRANVPAPARAAAAPIIVHRGGASMRTTRTAPSSSGSASGRRFGGGGGGFSGGGGVGSGGGGGSSGSW